MAAAPAPPAAGSGVRAALVARVRRQIAAGTYDSEDKIDAILDRIALELTR